MVFNEDNSIAVAPASWVEEVNGVRVHTHTVIKNYDVIHFFLKCFRF